MIKFKVFWDVTPCTLLRSQNKLPTQSSEYKIFGWLGYDGKLTAQPRVAIFGCTGV